MQFRTTAALAVTAVFALGLAACSAPAAEPQETGTVGQNEQSSTEGSGEGAEETTEDAPAAGAPVDGWPAEVPVPDAELAQDASANGQVAAAFSVADAAAGEAYIAQLEAAGFSALGDETEIAGVTARAFQGDTHIVAVSVVEAGGQTLLSVAIQPL